MIRNRKAVVIFSDDGYANAIKPRKIESFLKSENYIVDLCSTLELSRMGATGLRRKLPGSKPSQLFLYFLELSVYLGELFKDRPFATRVTVFALEKIIKVRGRRLYGMLKHANYDLLICENAFDEGIMLLPRVATVQILDLPAPLAEEKFFGGAIDKSGLERLRGIENEIYRNSDYLSFHWHTYSELVKSEKYDGPNYLKFEYGTQSKEKVAHYSKTPRIVFLGYLKGYWVNTPLLEALCESNPNIDVYGGPRPKFGSKINYKGYAPTTEVLADYQFGLVTISDDPLRRMSFSSKHLEYASYGLPVLTPRWRQDNVLESASIYYELANFKIVLDQSSGEETWTVKHQAALKLAEDMDWAKVFTEFMTVVRNIH